MFILYNYNAINKKCYAKYMIRLDSDFVMLGLRSEKYISKMQEI